MDSQKIDLLKQETLQEQAARIVDEEVTTAIYDPSKVKLMDYNGISSTKHSCEHCGDFKARGYMLITPIFPDELSLGAFSFFFCGKRCVKEWRRATEKKGFPMSKKRLAEIKEKTGRDYTPWRPQKTVPQIHPETQADQQL